MFCKNLVVYEINNNDFISKINDELLEKMRFKPCDPYSTKSGGFISPADNQKMMIDAGNHILLKYQTEQKMLPSDVIKQAYSERIHDMAAIMDRKLSRSECKNLKDEVINELLPKSFIRFRSNFIWINKTDETISLTTSFSNAEVILSHLRKNIGNLPVSPIFLDEPTEQVLTRWLRGENPTQFTIGDSAVLCDPLDCRSKISLSNEQVTDSEEVSSYLNHGKCVESLELNFNETIKFTLNKSLMLSKIRFLPSTIDQNKDIDTDDKEKIITADFLLATDILSSVIKEIRQCNN